MLKLLREELETFTKLLNFSHRKWNSEEETETSVIIMKLDVYQLLRLHSLKLNLTKIKLDTSHPSRPSHVKKVISDLEDMAASIATIDIDQLLLVEVHIKVMVTIHLKDRIDLIDIQEQLLKEILDMAVASDLLATTDRDLNKSKGVDLEINRISSSLP